MSDSFLRSILENPADDTLRLVYADWLEERGDPRGEFIRVQCELAVNRREWPGGVVPWRPLARREALERRERELLAAHAWTAYEMPFLSPWNRLLWGELPHPDNPHPQAYFRRGFVAAISVPCAAFLKHAAALFAAAPIEKVRLTDKTPASQANGVTFLTGCFWEPGIRYGMPHQLPFGLTEHLTHKASFIAGGLMVPRFESDVEAHAALSAACVRYGRAAVGLSTSHDASMPQNLEINPGRGGAPPSHRGLIVDAGIGGGKGGSPGGIRVEGGRGGRP